MGHLGANAVELQRAQQAEHGLWHALAHLDQGLVFGDFSIWQAVQAPGHPLQLARLMQAEQQLRRPTVLAHICCAQHAQVPSEGKDVVGLAHVR
jgi:hypothetical protein